MRKAILTIILFCIFFGGIVQAQSIKDSVSALAYKWYPEYETFLPYDKLDSELVYANEDSLPAIYQVCQSDLDLRPQYQSEYRFCSVKTNALFLAVLVANLGFEVELWEKWSLDIPVWYSPYDITSTKKLRLLAVQPEIRRWIKEAGKGHFFGLHTHVAGFNVAINDHERYQDPNHALWGMGLSYGYATYICKNKRWCLEFNLGVGFAEYDYDVYRNWANGPKFRSGSDWYWGVTRAGISISYKWYKERKK